MEQERGSRDRHRRLGFGLERLDVRLHEQTRPPSQAARHGAVGLRLFARASLAGQGRLDLVPVTGELRGRVHLAGGTKQRGGNRRGRSFNRFG